MSRTAVHEAIGEYGAQIAAQGDMAIPNSLINALDEHEMSIVRQVLIWATGANLTPDEAAAYRRYIDDPGAFVIEEQHDP